MAFTLQAVIDLLPDIYEEGKKPTGNIYKIFRVITEELNKIYDVFDDVAGLEDITNVYGATLDLLGLDYGLVRGGKTDMDFRALIQAKQNNFVDGNTINAIINYFSFFVPLEGITLIERFIEDLGEKLDSTWLLDGSRLLRGIGVRRARSFDVDTDTIPVALENSLTVALQILKSGGVEGTVNSL